MRRTRRDYSNSNELRIVSDPIALFRRWYRDAQHSGLLEPNAAALATTSRRGAPAVRFVLVRGINKDGFRFFTNYQSKKGGELALNPHAALAFYWETTERQIRIEGRVYQLSPAESLRYFRSRPRGAQVGAVVSKQSRLLSDPLVLKKLYSKKMQELKGKPVPMPKDWGGYRLLPKTIEFWQGKPNRLHDRVLYLQSPGGGWKAKRLYP